MEERIHYKIISLTYGLLRTSQPKYLKNLQILNLLVQLALPIILLYSAPLHLLSKYLIVHSTKPLLCSEIIYQHLRELSGTRYLILQPLANIPLYHSLTFWDPISLSSQNIPFQHVIPMLTFYPARTDNLDLYPNSTIIIIKNHTLHAYYFQYNVLFLSICRYFKMIHT